MAVHHRSLHWVQRPVGLTQILDREQRFAIERRQKLNARIDGFHPELPVAQLPDHDGARAAIALGTAFLGARTAEGFALIIQHGPCWFYSSYRDNFAA